MTNYNENKIRYIVTRYNDAYSAFSMWIDFPTKSSKQSLLNAYIELFNALYNQKVRLQTFRSIYLPFTSTRLNLKFNIMNFKCK